MRQSALRITVGTSALLTVLLLTIPASARPFPVQSATERPMPALDISDIRTIVAADTTWYGGTVWAADSNRWEAIPGGLWTFQSGVGSNTQPASGKPAGYHALMEGWTGFSFNSNSDVTFRRSTSCVIAGSYSMWAGKTQAEAEAACWAGGSGYGNGTSAVVEQTFAYPGAGNVTLQFNYAVDSESGFDYFRVAVRPSGAGSDVVLQSWDGVASGLGSFTLRTVDGTLPAGAGTVTVRFFATSDGSYSDEDGAYTTTCGLAAVDNITLSGAITHSADFESSDGGWTVPSPSPVIDNFSNLLDVDDLPPPAGFSGQCGAIDSVLVFIDPNGQHPAGQTNVAVSPWIDLKANGDDNRPNLTLAFDHYSGTNTPVTPNHVWGVQYYPWTCPTTGVVGVSPIVLNNAFFFFGSPTCGHSTHDLRIFIPQGADQVRVVLGPHWFENLNTNAGPWFDNIRVGASGGGTSGTPVGPAPKARAFLGDAYPNPAVGVTQFAFGVARDATPTRIDVFDVAGRIVRTLVDEPMTAGRHSVSWDVRGADGREVGAGLYFYRMVSGEFVETRKLLVVH